MLIWYESDIARSIKIVQTNQFYIRLAINRAVMSTEKNIFLCAAYIPPAESPHFSFSILEEDINHFQSQGSELICGDVNGRTGEEPDTVNSQGDKHLPGQDTTTSATYSNINQNRMKTSSHDVLTSKKLLTQFGVRDFYSS